MKLAAFSVSLSVKDLTIPKTFYENLEFSVFAGDPEKKYLIMKSEAHLIGFFQRLFENNILTSNPGWDNSAKPLGAYDDVRTIQKHLKSKSIKLETEVNTETSSPGSFILLDPDGNAILIDQHV